MKPCLVPQFRCTKTYKNDSEALEMSLKSEKSEMIGKVCNSVP